MTDPKELLKLIPQNPVIQTVVGLYGMTVFAFLFKSIPAKIINFFKTHFTTELVIYNNESLYNRILQMLSANEIHWYNMQVGLGSTLVESDDSCKTLIGYGTSLCKYGSKRCLVTRSVDSSNQTQHIKETLRIRILGRNKQFFYSMIQDIREEETPFLDVARYDIYNGLDSVRGIPKRPFSSVIINSKIKEDILSLCDSFFKNKDWYRNNGIPHRLGIMLEGSPGTGKSSVIKALATHYNKPIIFANTRSLMNTISNIKTDYSFVVIEDLDCLKEVKSRDDEDESLLESSKSSEQRLDEVLNAIDGITTPEPIVWIATTNHLDKIDPALLREGRFGNIFHIGVMDDDSFHEFLARFYSEPVSHLVLKKEVTPAEMQRYVLRHKTDFNGLIQHLTEDEVI